MAKASTPGVVGYGSPPTQSRFKKGQSGNPHGRPKKTPSFGELLEREGRRLVQLKTANGVTAISKLEGLVRRVYQMGMEGDLAAARLIFQATVSQHANRSEDAPDSAIDVEAFDDDTIHRMLRRLSTPVEDADR